MALADLARGMGVCQVTVSGPVKVIRKVEAVQFHPPNFRADEDATRVTLFAPRDFSEMTREERLRACGQHAVIMGLQSKRMTNATLTERLGLPSDNHGITLASVIIMAALEKGLIKHSEPSRPCVGLVLGEN